MCIKLPATDAIGSRGWKAMTLVWAYGTSCHSLEISSVVTPKNEKFGNSLARVGICRTMASMNVTLLQ